MSQPVVRTLLFKPRANQRKKKKKQEKDGHQLKEKELKEKNKHQMFIYIYMYIFIFKYLRSILGGLGQTKKKQQICLREWRGGPDTNQDPTLTPDLSR